MTPKIWQTNRPDPVLVVKGYGKLVLSGGDAQEIICQNYAEEDFTLYESDECFYITTMHDCEISIPSASQLRIEKCLGSVHLNNLTGEIQAEKIVGNLLLKEIKDVNVLKVGGNCTVSGLTGQMSIEKVGGNFAGFNLQSLSVEKIGGNCYLADSNHQISIDKIGGNLYARNLTGHLDIQKVGGECCLDAAGLGITLHVGGDLELALHGEGDYTEIKAGGDIKAHLLGDVENINCALRAGGDVRVKWGDKKIKQERTYDFELGDGHQKLSLKAGGDITVTDQVWDTSQLIPDQEKFLSLEESALSEIIHKQVETATRLAEQKIRLAQERLEKMKMNINVNVDDVIFEDDFMMPTPPKPPKPPKPPRPFHRDFQPVVSPKKGATDEERLFILQMLQEKKISVAEAEDLFKALDRQVKNG